MNLSKDTSVQEVLARLREADPQQGPVEVFGTWGSFAPLLASYLQRELTRPVLYISPHVDDADSVSDDLSVFLGRPVETFAVWEELQEFADATDEIGAQRLRIVLDLAARRQGKMQPFLLSTCIQALNQPVPDPEVLREGGLQVACGQTMELERAARWLIDNGFEAVDRVDVPGEFARRGGILDIFAPVTSQPSGDGSGACGQDMMPLRIELFGDEVESIRRIDLDTQRSADSIEEVCVIAPQGHERLDRTELFVNLLPADTLVILEEPSDIAEVSDTFLRRVEDPRGLYSWEAIHRALGRFTRVHISRFAASKNKDVIELNVTSAQQYEHKTDVIRKGSSAVVDDLLEQSRGQHVVLYCENAAEQKRVTEMVEELVGGIPSHLELRLGFIKQGFVLTQLRTVVLSHHELFGQYAVRRRIRSIRAVSPVENMLDLTKGDYVVHVSYGIGKFLGIQTLIKQDTPDEYLTLEYAGKTRIHVPVKNISLIHKYVGALPKRPPLSKIGTKKWERQKERVAQGVQELAEQLLEIQAKREQMGGFSFGEDSKWQREFEESFLYQETPDQITVVEEIKQDLQASIPMDRLLCGDVGYGKTELAMRAAFKVVEAGKQVAVLVPTTVLCVQHGRSFQERFADFPVVIEVLNRFVTPKHAAEITTAAKKGQIDILIGTHRLLSKDVGFKDLGLLIIDEEQRFGVEHKEKLKRFRVNVDVLTMSATPIPRTLHMSMLGLRDISSLTTPPLDRRSIVTKVSRFDPDLIRRAIFHELNRQGQVFFVHNRVRSILRMASEIRHIIDDGQVRVDVAHGQMHKHELEEAMIRFVTGQTHVLVCSTIIESGLDIPNANTIIVNEADRFGLAQLHQLRGRVGRYKHRAYAYMLLPQSRPIRPVAAKRLKAIEEYSQLGSGFRIALRDLEIRGAGNILGPEQSGHINTVGYELYCQLLGNAVKKLKNEPVEENRTPLIDLGFSTYIPKSYIPSDRQRMDVYRRIAVARTDEDLDRLRLDLEDLFGKPPRQVLRLVDLAQLRIAAGQWNIKSIIVSEKDLIFSFRSNDGVRDLFAKAPGTVRIPDPNTVYVRPGSTYFEPDTLLSVLRKMLRSA